MLSGTQGRILLAVLVLTIVVSTIAIMAGRPHKAMAQVPPGMDQMGPMSPGDMPPPGNMGPGPGMRPGMGGMMGGMGGMMPMGMMGGGGTAIAANTKYVYVVIGMTVYQLNADTLKEVSKTTLQPPAPQMPGGGGGAAPGAGFRRGGAGVPTAPGQ